MTTYGKKRRAFRSAFAVFYDSGRESSNSSRLSTAESAATPSLLDALSSDGLDELAPQIKPQPLRSASDAFSATSVLTDVLNRTGLASARKLGSREKPLPPLPLTSSAKSLKPTASNHILLPRSANLKMPKITKVGSKERSPTKLDRSKISEPFEMRRRDASLPRQLGSDVPGLKPSALPRSTSAFDFSHFFKSSSQSKLMVEQSIEEEDPLAFDPELVRSIQQMTSVDKGIAEETQMPPKKNKAVLAKVKERMVGNTGSRPRRHSVASGKALLENIGPLSETDSEHGMDQDWNIAKDPKIYETIKASPKLKDVLGAQWGFDRTYQNLATLGLVSESPQARRARPTSHRLHKDPDYDLIFGQDDDDPFTDSKLDAGIASPVSAKKSTTREIKAVHARRASMAIDDALSVLKNSGRMKLDVGSLSRGRSRSRSRTPSRPRDYHHSSTINIPGREPFPNGLRQHPNVLSFAEPPLFMTEEDQKGSLQQNNKRDGMAMARSPLKRIEGGNFAFLPDRYRPFKESESKTYVSSFSTNATNEYSTTTEGEDDEALTHDPLLPIVTIKRASDASKRSSAEAGLFGSPLMNKKTRNGSPSELNSDTTMGGMQDSSDMQTHVSTHAQATRLSDATTMHGFKGPRTPTSMFKFPQGSSKRDSIRTITADKDDRTIVNNSNDRNEESLGIATALHVSTGKLRRPRQDRRASMPVQWPAGPPPNFSMPRVVNIKPPPVSKSALARAANATVFTGDGSPATRRQSMSRTTDDANCVSDEEMDGMWTPGSDSEDELSRDDDDMFQIGRAR